MAQPPRLPPPGKAGLSANDGGKSGGRVQNIRLSNSGGCDTRCIGRCSRRTARRPRETPGPLNLRSRSGLRGALVHRRIGSPARPGS
eukprot:2670597-Pleurochrysis_carterae.AAC.2